MSKKRKLITYATENRQLEVHSQENLLELCLDHKLPINHVCEGGASCGTCRVIVLSDSEELPLRNHLEQSMAKDRRFQSNERLACQLPLTKEFSFKFPTEST